MCTKFATEIILQYSDGEWIIVTTVLPAESRPKQFKLELQGLISVANDEQTEEDVRTVQDLVDSYVANPRTIILGCGPV